MSNRADSVRVARPLFQEARGGSTPTSALDLWIETCSPETAKNCNRLWHSRLPRIGDPPGCSDAFDCFAAEHDGLIYAVAIWSHPVSRSLPQDTWLELRRLAVAPDAPRNTPSRMLAVMARLLRKSFPILKVLMSYHDMGVHTGAIYRAAGWKPTIVKKATSWTNAVRMRPNDQAFSDKQRWELEL